MLEVISQRKRTVDWTTDTLTSSEGRDLGSSERNRRRSKSFTNYLLDRDYLWPPILLQLLFTVGRNGPERTWRERVGRDFGTQRSANLWIRERRPFGSNRVKQERIRRPLWKYWEGGVSILNNVGWDDSRHVKSEETTKHSGSFHPQTLSTPWKITKQFINNSRVRNLSSLNELWQDFIKWRLWFHFRNQGCRTTKKRVGERWNQRK